MKNRPEVIALALLAAVATYFLWRHFSASVGESPAKRAAIEINRTLPKPYVDGLVIERAHVAGDRLVLDIRIPDTRLASLDPEKIPVIRAQEQSDLLVQTCDDPQLRPLMDGGTAIARRFLDQDRQLIFEIAATTTDCPKGKML